MTLVLLHGLFVGDLIFFYLFVFSPSLLHPFLWFSSLLRSSHYVSVLFHFLFFILSLIIFSSHFSLLFFLIPSFLSPSFSTSLLFLFSLLLFLLFLFISFYWSLFLFFPFLLYFFNVSSVPLIGHSHKVWRTLTLVKPLISHVRDLRLTEMEFSKITCYVLETSSYQQS